MTSATMQIELSKGLPGTWRFRHAANSLINKGRLSFDVPAISQFPADGVLVVTDPGSDEASAAAGVLIGRIGPEA